MVQDMAHASRPRSRLGVEVVVLHSLDPKAHTCHQAHPRAAQPLCQQLCQQRGHADHLSAKTSISYDGTTDGMRLECVCRSMRFSHGKSIWGNLRYRRNTALSAWLRAAAGDLGSAATMLSKASTPVIPM